MRKVIYVCDLCGDEYKERLFWTLERNNILPSVYMENRKEVMHICGWCANWIIKQRGKGMTREEAIELLDDLDGAIEDNHGRDYDEAFRMAIEALNREQQIIENGYKGKEMRIRIGGKLFAVRELAQ